MPQLSYSQNAIAAQPGMAFDLDASSSDSVSRIAAVNIPFGVYCELTSTGLAQPLQDSTTGAAFPGTAGLIGISKFEPFANEQQYVSWQVPAALAGTILVTNASASVTFSTAQTLPAGAELVFASQPGVIYFLQTALAAATAGTLTAVYSGVTAAATTTTQLGAGSTAIGWAKGMVVPFKRRGRIWVAGDATGTALRYGAINVNHSSTAAFAQGVFTFSAVSATAGHEIDIAPSCTVWNPDLLGGTTGITYTDPFGNTFKVYPVEINL
jgi:hypothetical protein